MKPLKHITLFVAGALVLSTTAMAQENGETPLDTLTRHVAAQQQMLDLLNRIKLSGYIQAQFQYADSSGQSSFAGGDFKPGVDKRFMVRRARLKAQYDAPLNDKGFSTSQYVLQFDISEKGVTIKDVYAKFTDPWSGWFSVTAGMQNRPFGYEIGYSSGLRESPERGRMSQLIFPNERDLGAMITIQGPKTGNWNWIKLDGGMFNGTGGPGQGADASDFDKFKDFIGHLSLIRSFADEKVKVGIGGSYYNGGFRVDSVNVWKAGEDSNGVAGFVKDSKASDNWNKGFLGSRNEAKRQYIGGDIQVSIDWLIGITTLRGEYIQGDQPGFTSSSAPWNATKSPAAVVTSDIYNRKFNGAYFYFLQNVMQTPFQIIVKYDWYDPNTDVEGDAIGQKVTSESKATGAGDIKYETWGFGLAYRWDANVKITAYYDMVKNEVSKNLSGYGKDLTDNVFTLRAQVKF